MGLFIEMSLCYELHDENLVNKSMERSKYPNTCTGYLKNICLLFKDE